jgi:plasmid maintenance system killer protein
VEIDFADRALARLVGKAAAMQRELGASRAKKLALRMAALRAVDSAVDLLPLPGRWHALVGDWKGHMSGDLDHPYRLVVRPQNPPPLTEDGGIDWAATKAITVVGVVDTHQ